jgi:hypothetical protein
MRGTEWLSFAKYNDSVAKTPPRVLLVSITGVKACPPNKHSAANSRLKWKEDLVAGDARPTVSMEYSCSARHVKFPVKSLI